MYEQLNISCRIPVSYIYLVILTFCNFSKSKSCDFTILTLQGLQRNRRNAYRILQWLLLVGRNMRCTFLSLSRCMHCATAFCRSETICTTPFPNRSFRLPPVPYPISALVSLFKVARVITAKFPLSYYRRARRKLVALIILPFFRLTVLAAATRLRPDVVRCVT